MEYSYQFWLDVSGPHIQQSKRCYGILAPLILNMNKIPQSEIVAGKHEHLIAPNEKLIHLFYIYPKIYIILPHAQKIYPPMSYRQGYFPLLQKV